MNVTKAIIPAAGLGTRFLPATKSIPKEMVPILDKPAIQYIVEEGLSSDIENFLVITSKNKVAIADHFDTSCELNTILKERGKEAILASINDIVRKAHFTYIRQHEPLGLGHAILMARHTIAKEHFGIFLPDDIIHSKQPCMGQLIKAARQEKASIIAVQEVPADRISAYGVIAIKKQLTQNMFQVGYVVEKPSIQDAPSNLGIVGRYVLSHKIFDALEAIKPYTDGELQLTDAIAKMISDGEKVIAYKIQGQRYDIGNPMGLLTANIGIGLQHPKYGKKIRELFDTNFLDALAGKFE